MAGALKPTSKRALHSKATPAEAAPACVVTAGAKAARRPLLLSHDVARSSWPARSLVSWMA
eukprot:5615227-Lingulodinium_polyedra.AAC.1